MEYSKATKLFHWLIALSILGVGILGIYMEDLDKSEFKFMLYDYHKAFGVLAFLFISGMLIGQIGKDRPKPPAEMSRGEALFAKLVKRLIVILIFAVIALGYLASSAFPFKEGIWFFGMELPAIIGKDKELSHSLIEVHNTLGIALLILSLLHIVGVIKHKILHKKSDILKRML